MPPSKSRKPLLIVLLTALFLVSACTAEQLAAEALLKKAAIKGNVDAVKTALSQGADVNARKGGWTVLMGVAREGHAEIAQLLLAHGLLLS